MTVPPEAQELLTRLARMKRLLAELESVASESVQQTEMCVRLRQEIDAARLSLKLPGATAPEKRR